VLVFYGDSRLAAAAARMALVTVNTVVHIPAHVRVAEVSGVVAAMAGRALKYGVVIRIRMARGADAVGIAMVDRESRVLRVIECRTSPCGRGMAGRAGGRKELRLRSVARVGGVVVVGLMATDTCRRQCRVIAVDVAVGAYPRRCLVRAGQGERRVVVIKGGIRPDSCVVAEFARCRESSRSVGRIGGACVVLLVARVAECAVQRVVVVHVAVGAQARRNRVRSR